MRCRLPGGSHGVVAVVNGPLEDSRQVEVVGSAVTRGEEPLAITGPGKGVIQRR